MAHRGGEKLWPSNTIYAYQRAVDLGVDALELDIHLSADGALIVRHDPVVDTTTNGQGAIADLTLAQIKALDAGYTWSSDGGRSFPFRGQGVNIPSLDEVFAAFPGICINIDIKPDDDRATDFLVETIRRYNRQTGVRIGSFNDRQLARFRRALPETPTAAGARETKTFYLLSRIGLSRLYRPPCQAFQVPEFAGRVHLVTPAFIRAAHAAGIEVHVWTVDEIDDMQRLIHWGVDGLITDYPDRLMEIRHSA
jgi:glycerophosphoryl diester phosphodiesterase